MDSYAVMGIISFVIIGVLGIGARLFWSGFQATLIRSILDSTLDKMLGDFNKTIERIESDIHLIKSSQEQQRTIQIQNTSDFGFIRQDLNNIRIRLDAHLTESNEINRDYYDFKRVVMEFIQSASGFMKHHEHGSAVMREAEAPKPTT